MIHRWPAFDDEQKISYMPRVTQEHAETMSVKSEFAPVQVAGEISHLARVSQD